jgi:hypothetical protein
MGRGRATQRPDPPENDGASQRGPGEGETVKKFLMLHYGYEEPTPEMMAAWEGWFAKVGDHFADMGSPLGNGLEVTKTAKRDLSPDAGAPTGYSIISAESREDAERLLKGCPIISSVQLYEAMRME